MMECRIKEIRKAKHMTQEELAERSGVSRATISAMENGVDRNSASETLRRLASALDVTIDQLYYAEDGESAKLPVGLNGYFELTENGGGYCGQSFSNTRELLDLLEQYAREAIKITVSIELAVEHTTDADSGDGA